MIKAPPYKTLPKDERKRVAESCLNGSNSNRASYAKEIEAGKLFNREGYPRSYWHCLATVAPPPPEGRRGQWVAKPGDYRGGFWRWDDWGPEKAEPSFDDNVRKVFGIKAT